MRIVDLILTALEDERQSAEKNRSDSTGVERRWYDGIACGLASAIGIVEALDSKNTARWVDVDGCMGFCSNCYTLGCGTRYCPNCGRRMEVAKDEID